MTDDSLLIHLLTMRQNGPARLAGVPRYLVTPGTLDRIIAALQAPSEAKA